MAFVKTHGLPVKRLVTLFVVLSVTPLLLLTFLSVHLATRAVSNEAGARVTAYAGETVTSMQTGMTNLRSLVASYAQRRALQTALANPNPGQRGKTDALAQLRQLGALQGSKTTLLLVDSAGRVVAADPVDAPIAREPVAFRSWFTQTLRTGRPLISQPYRSRTAGQPLVLAATAPVVGTSGKSLGVLVAVSELGALQAYSDYFATSLGVQLTITDRNGTVLAHPSKKSGTTEPANKALIAKALAGQTGVGSLDSATGQTLTAYAPIPGLGWAVTAGLPHTVVFKRIDRLRTTVYSVAAALAFVLLAGLGLLVRTLRQRQRAETAARETQRALEEARVAADEARQQAEGANAAKSEFLSRMSHELRTPLNAVLGFGQLLELDDLTDEQDESVEQIMKAGQHLLGLINEVLDISRIEAGGLSLSLEPVDLCETLHEAIALVRPIAEQRNVRISADTEGSSCYVSADRQRLKQVLLNLLSNAVKYNRDGGTVRITLTESSDTVKVAVADTGEGIAPDKLTKLFQPFERLGADLKQIEGTGLGLVLTKGLVEAMGGQIEAESDDSGSTFWIKLQAADAPLDAALTELERISESGRNGAAPVTILYIEDNLSNLKLVERILQQRPEINLISAMQGSLGLELARQHRPQLILLDLHLPDLQGDEVLTSLRSYPETTDVPVIVLSADATQGRIQRLLDQGADEYLSKPIDVHRFLELLDQHTKQPVQPVRS
jgi:signal transduction histidine kinase/ActR/RegA family two-component response regulator